MSKVCSFDWCGIFAGCVGLDVIRNKREGVGVVVPLQRCCLKRVEGDLEW